MKNISGKQKTNSNFLSKALKAKQRITEKESGIAGELNQYFTGIGSPLARKIPIVTKTKHVSEYLTHCSVSTEHKELSFQEF